QGRLRERRRVARGEPALQARRDAERLGQIGLPLLERRAALRGGRGQAVARAARDAEQGMRRVGEQLLGDRRAHAARRAGDDEELPAAWASATFEGWMPANAHS